ncbi:MAG: S1 RNA-binding domain-containing protein [Kiritimatiellaeota bacterium]|nr:S1 RNA-binding domain-containing protein [Kiritimatiellota bacterium]
MLQKKTTRPSTGVSMAELMGTVESQLKTYRKGFNPGEAVVCTVVAVERDALILDMNAKMGGVVDRMDLNQDNPLPQVGDRLALYFVGMRNGAARFTTTLSGGAADALDAETKREALKAKLREGDIVEGKAVKIMPFGVFVDLGGVDGLIPNRELSWDTEAKAEDIVSVGAAITASVLELDWENDRVTLSLRSVQKDPWELFCEEYGTGNYVTGTVTKLMPFGAFVRLAPSVEGLIPISKLGEGRRLNHAREALKEGETIDVRIEEIDAARRKIALTPAAAVEREEASAKEAEELSALLQGNNAKQAKDFGSLGALLSGKL